MSGCARVSARCAAFTLIELLVVIGIMVILLTLMVPAFNAIKGGSDVTSSSSQLVDVLQQARSYAMGNNTYVWVGFFEEDAGSNSTATPHPAGTGRVCISVVASKDGVRYKDGTVDNGKPASFDNSVNPRPTDNPVVLVQLNKLMKLENQHLAGLNTNDEATNVPKRPAVSGEYQVGDTVPVSNPDFTKHPQSFGAAVLNPTTFTYPLSGTVQYLFRKIIEFTPRGEATKIVDFPAPWIEIGLQLTHGTTIDTANPNRIVVQIAGTSAEIKMYRR